MQSHRHRTIPLEITEHIIDQIGSFSRNLDHDVDTTLKALCLVHRSFINRCQHYLFESIRFTCETEERLQNIELRYLRLKSAIEISPRIAFHIRNLYLVVDPRQSGSLSSEVLKGILGLPKNLELFKLRFANATWSWNSIPAAFQDTLFDFIVRSSIVTLRLEQIGDLPASFATLFTTIPEVQLKKVSFDLKATNNVREDQTDTVLQPSIPKLKHLKITNVPYRKSIQRLIDAVSRPECPLEALSYMCIMDSDKAERAVQKLLKSRASSLTKLEWTLSRSWLTHESAPEDIVDLGLLPNLHRLKIVANITPFGPRRLVFNDIVQVLSSASTRNKIETLELRLSNANFMELSPQLKEKLREPNWDELDAILSGPTFPNLRIVYFTLKNPHVAKLPSSWDGDALESIESGLRRYFPLTHERGIIRRESIAYFTPYFCMWKEDPQLTWEGKVRDVMFQWREMPEDPSEPYCSISC